LASLAAHAISSSAGTAIHAHGAKSHGKTEGRDSFADLLSAAYDAAAENPAAQTAPAPGTAQHAAARQDTTDKEDSTDIALDTAEQQTLVASSTAAPKPLPTDVPADKTADESEDVKPAANDNDGDAQPAPALPQPVMPAPQPQIQAQAPTQSQDQNIAPVAANMPAAAPAAAPQSDDADQDANEATAATQATATDKATAAAAKSTKPAGDFKKMLEGTKLAAAKNATADAAQTQNADATKADVTKADAGKAEAQLADARPASPQAGARTDNQPNIQPAAVNAPQQPVANNIHAPEAPVLPASAPHHAPNMLGLAVDIATRSQSGAKQFDIRLDPPELGRVEVRLSIDSTGKAEAHLTADQPRTLELLQKDAPALTRALREAGLDVSQDGLNFSLRQQQQQAGQDQPQFQSGRTLRANFAAPSTETATGAAAYSGRAQGLLDIRV